MNRMSFRIGMGKMIRNGYSPAKAFARMKVLARRSAVANKAIKTHKARFYNPSYSSRRYSKTFTFGGKSGYRIG